MWEDPVTGSSSTPTAGAKKREMKSKRVSADRLVTMTPRAGSERRVAKSGWTRPHRPFVRRLEEDVFRAHADIDGLDAQGPDDGVGPVRRLGQRRPGREVELDAIAVPPGREEPAQRLEPRLVVGGQEALFPKDVGRGQGRVAAELDFDLRREPAQAEAVALGPGGRPSRPGSSRRRRSASRTLSAGPRRRQTPAGLPLNGSSANASTWKMGMAMVVLLRRFRRPQDITFAKAASSPL